MPSLRFSELNFNNLLHYQQKRGQRNHLIQSVNFLLCTFSGECVILHGWVSLPNLIENRQHPSVYNPNWSDFTVHWTWAIFCGRTFFITHFFKCPQSFMLIQETATTAFFTLIICSHIFVRAVVVTSILLLWYTHIYKIHIFIYVVFCYQLDEVTEALNTLQIHVDGFLISTVLFLFLWLI